MDPEKLKFFTSKLKIWDYEKISALELQNLSFEDKSKILAIIILKCQLNR